MQFTSLSLLLMVFILCSLSPLVVTLVGDFSNNESFLTVVKHGRWSLMSDTSMHASKSDWKSLPIMMLSMRVAVDLVTLVGLVMVGSS